MFKEYFYYKCPKCNKRTIPYIQLSNLFSPKSCNICKISLLPKNILGIFKRQFFLLAILFILLKVYFWGIDVMEKTMILEKNLLQLINVVIGGILVLVYMLATIICDTQMTEMTEFDDFI